MFVPVKRPLLILAFGISVLPLIGRADDWPTLRQTNYVALLGAPGKEMKLSIRSEQRTPRYADELSFMLVGPDSNELACGDIPLGSGTTVSAGPTKDGLCVLELEPGWNVCYVDSGETPSAHIASARAPLQTIKEIERLYFHVPEGCKQFVIYVMASVTGEAARIQVFSPEGQIVKEEEGDYDRTGQIKVDVPAGSGGKVWSLAVAKPKAQGLGLDDVTLWLDPKLPPYLSKKAEWASAFGARRHE